MKTISHAIFPALFLLGLLTACGKATPIGTVSPETTASLPPVDTVNEEDNSVVHGRAIFVVTSEQQSSLAKIFNNLWMSSAYATSNGATNVTYTNGASTTFTINVGAFSPGTLSNNILSLGSVALAGLNDNNLKVCGSSNNAKCTQAVIRVYTTGSISGFVNTVDGYGVPVFTGALNPATPVGLLSAGSVPVQTLSIPSTKHTVALSDFPTPSYAVTADFVNGGAGAYSMTYVLEYALLP